MALYLGVTGTFASGKNTFGDLIKKHFKAEFLGTADVLREETAARGLGLERPNLVRVANDLRATRGHGYLAEKCAEKLKTMDVEVGMVSDLRNVGEIEALRKAFGKDLKLIAIDSDKSVRYARAKSRKRWGEDFLSFEEWAAAEEKELHPKTDDPSVQNIGACMALTDYTIYNNGSIEELEKASVELVRRLLGN